MLPQCRTGEVTRWLRFAVYWSVLMPSCEVV